MEINAYFVDFPTSAPPDIHKTSYPALPHSTPKPQRAANFVPTFRHELSKIQQKYATAALHNDKDAFRDLYDRLWVKQGNEDIEGYEADVENRKKSQIHTKLRTQIMMYLYACWYFKENFATKQGEADSKAAGNVYLDGYHDIKIRMITSQDLKFMFEDKDEWHVLSFKKMFQEQSEESLRKKFYEFPGVKETK